MPRNGSGSYTLPSGNPVVTNTVISSSGWANPTLNDIAAAITDSIAADGQTSPSANLTMGNFRLMNLGSAIAAADAVNAGQIQGGLLTTLSSVSGTDTITASTSPATTAYAAGQCFDFIPAGSNLTDAVTLNINSLGAKNVTKLGANALNIGDLNGVESVRVRYDGTQFQVISPLPGTLSGKNRLINGSFLINQINSLAAVTPTATAYVADQWQAAITQASKLTFQTISAPSGFSSVANAEKISVASAYTPVSTDNFVLRQPIEGYNLADLQWGTSLAKPVTVQLQVSASLTGTYSVYFTNYAGTRAYVATVNVTVANTPQPFQITIPGDTAGTWATIGSTGFLYFGIDLGSGSNFNATAGAWGAGASTRTSGSVSLVSNAGASITVSAIQLENGTLATPLEERPIGVELLLCQRYFYVFTSTQWWGYIASTSDTNNHWEMTLPVTMRATPTTTFTDAGTQGTGGTVAATTQSWIYLAGSGGSAKYINSFNLSAQL